MARQNGILRLTGAIGGISFYKTQDGYLARSKGGPTPEQVSGAASFARTRENNSEFGACVQCGSLLKQSIWSLARPASDGRITSRLNQLMHQIKELDSSNKRGERTVASGLMRSAGKALLRSLVFNEQAEFGKTLRRQVTVNSNGVISVNSLDPSADIHFPPGATHTEFSGGRARIDFTTKEKEFFRSNSVTLTRNQAAFHLSLTPAGVPGGTGIDIFVLRILFFQEINGSLHPLKDRGFNSVGIVEVR